MFVVIIYMYINFHIIVDAYRCRNTKARSKVGVVGVAESPSLLLTLILFIAFNNSSNDSANKQK